jgi:dihydrofolate reductase
MNNISIIVAIAENNAIGKDNNLLWHLSEDLKRFKKLTMGNNVIMGKKTFESLPNGALQGRNNIVITDDKNDSFHNCVMAFSIEDAIEKSDKSKENFIIGGGSVYRQFLPFADKLYLTVVHKSFAADIFFPEINFNEWEKIYTEENNFDEQSSLSYSYFILQRKNS